MCFGLVQGPRFGLAVALCWLAPGLAPAAGQDRPAPIEPPATIVWNELEGSEPWPSDLQTMQSLPTPPDDLQSLLRMANLQFKFYDPTRLTRRFTGETRMAVQYQLDFTYRWKIEGTGRRRILVVDLTHRPTQFTFYHQVLLPIDMATESLYQRPLVQHELDHVRIATDPRYRNLFDQWLQADTATLKLELDRRATERDFPQLIQEAVQEQARERFQRMLQLLQVRNRELDRLTQHGQQPLPADFFSDPPAPTLPPR